LPELANIDHLILSVSLPRKRELEVAIALERQGILKLEQVKTPARVEQFGGRYAIRIDTRKQAPLLLALAQVVAARVSEFGQAQCLGGPRRRTGGRRHGMPG
jgi:hypothetical protein